MARRGQSAATLRALRKRYKLGEFAPKRGKRAAKRAAKLARRRNASLAVREDRPNNPYFSMSPFQIDVPR